MRRPKPIMVGHLPFQLLGTSMWLGHARVCDEYIVHAGKEGRSVGGRISMGRGNCVR